MLPICQRDGRCLYGLAIRDGISNSRLIDSRHCRHFMILFLLCSKEMLCYGHTSASRYFDDMSTTVTCSPIRRFRHSASSHLTFIVPFLRTSLIFIALPTTHYAMIDLRLAWDAFWDFAHFFDWPIIIELPAISQMRSARMIFATAPACCFAISISASADADITCSRLHILPLYHFLFIYIILTPNATFYFTLLLIYFIRAISYFMFIFTRQ